MSVLLVRTKFHPITEMYRPWVQKTSKSPSESNLNIVALRCVQCCR